MVAGLASILAPSHKEVALCGQVGTKEFRDVVGMLWDWWDGDGLLAISSFGLRQRRNGIGSKGNAR